MKSSRSKNVKCLFGKESSQLSCLFNKTFHGKLMFGPQTNSAPATSSFFDFYPCFQLTNTMRVHNCERWIGSAPPSMHRFPTSFLHLPTVHPLFSQSVPPFSHDFPHHFPLGCGECDIVAYCLQVVQLVQPGGWLHDLSICGNQHKRTLKKGAEGVSEHGGFTLWQFNIAIENDKL